MAWNFRFYWMNFANLVTDVLEIFGGMWQGLALFWKMMYHLKKVPIFVYQVEEVISLKTTLVHGCFQK